MSLLLPLFSRRLALGISHHFILIFAHSFLVLSLSLYLAIFFVLLLASPYPSFFFVYHCSPSDHPLHLSLLQRPFYGIYTAFSPLF